MPRQGQLQVIPPHPQNERDAKKPKKAAAEPAPEGREPRLRVDLDAVDARFREIRVDAAHQPLGGVGGDDADAAHRAGVPRERRLDVEEGGRRRGAARRPS